MTQQKDRIFSQPLATVEDFAFDERVADVFDDMIRRSLPGYGVVLDMLGAVAERFALAGSTVYDLGCSLGAVTLSIGRALPHRDVELVALDNSAAMVERCRRVLERSLPSRAFRVECADLRDATLNNASLVVMNFVLQFLPVAEREALLRRIAQALLPGGVLVLSEKVVFERPEQQQLFEQLHDGFRVQNGYSELEISQKRAALERVLVPETIEAHRERLLRAGFSRVELWFQCANFVSFLAFKDEAGVGR